MTKPRHLLLAWAILALSVPCVSAQEQADEAKKSAANKPTLPSTWVDTLQWRSIGPANMSGRIVAITVYEKDPNLWWAATASGGLLKTTNNGVTFEHQFDRQATVSIGDVKVAQSDPNIVWVGTGEANPRNSVSWGDGVYKSTDGGKTWTNMGLKDTFQIGRMAIHPTNPDIVYVGALGRLWGPSEERGLYKTTDGGKTWEKILYVDDKTGVIDLQMNPKDPDTLLVATYERQRDGFDGNDPAKKFGPGAGVYRTTNGGKTFKKVNKGLPTCNLGRIGLSIYRKNPQHVYMVLESEKIGQQDPNTAFMGIRGENADVGARITEVTAKGPAEKAGIKKDDIVIAVNGATIHSYEELLSQVRRRRAGDKAKLEISRDRKSVELEITFDKRPEPEQSSRRRSAPTTPEERARAGSPFAASLGGQRENMQDDQGEDGFEYGGVYHSKDGGVSWERINSVNPRPMYYSQIRVDPTDNQYIWVLGTSLYLSKDGGKTFSSEGTARGIHVDHHSMWISPQDGRRVILGNDGGIHVTYDRGENWDHLNHVAIGQFYHVTVGPRRNYWVYGGLQDNGSWGGPQRGGDGRGAINSDWIRIGGGDGFICLVDPNDPNQIYYESQGGAAGRVNLKTDERGSIRPRPPRGTRYRFNWKTPFILSPHNSRIYYNAGNYVFRSLDKGEGIRAISPDITRTDDGTGSALAESPVEEGVLYVGTTDGALWVTRNGGHEWTNIFGQREEKEDDEQEKEEEGDEQEETKPDPTKEPQSSDDPESAEQDPVMIDIVMQPPRGRRAAPGRMLEMLKDMDADGDGKIQRKEMPERMQRLFDRLDANGDGAIDRDEIRAAQQAMSGGPRFGARRDPQEAEQEKQQEQEATKEQPQEEAGETKSAAAKPIIEKDTVSGTWEGRFQAEGMPADRSTFTLVMRMDPQGKITGSFKSTNSEGDGEGKFDPKTGQLSFVLETERATIEVLGTVTEGSMSGQVDVNSGMFTVDFTAKRTGDAPATEEAGQGEEEEAPAGEPLSELLPGPRWVSSIEASRFKAGRAYVTFDGHRSDDDETYVMVTEDYGKSWRSLRANLPEVTGSARVIREDIVNQDLLYLGTEFGIWVSIDRGETWTKLNSNLPTVAVHEVAIHPTAGEIVAGTHGRSLWVLDVSALRQLTAETIAADATLYRPTTAIKWRSEPSRGQSGTRRFVGAVPPSGAPICYSLGKKAQSVKITITDVQRRVLRELDGNGEAGLHRVVWDLRAVTQGEQSESSRFRRGRTVDAGEYLVTLTVDGQEYKQVVRVEDQPEEE